MKKSFIEDVKYYSLIAILVTIVFSFQIQAFVKSATCLNDFHNHMWICFYILTNKSLFAAEVPPHIIAHPFYHLLSVFVSGITKISIYDTCVYVIPILTHLVSGLFIFYTLNNTKYKSSNKLLVFLVSISLLIVTPISFLSFPSHNIGYIGINVFHSPTQILVKLVSLGFFFFCIKVIFSKKSNFIDNLFMYGLLVASLLTKPNYILCVLPSIVVFALLSKILDFNTNFKPLLYLLFAGFIVLVWQFWMVYFVGNTNISHEETKLIFSPFKVMLAYNKWYLILPKFLASILFPLVVVVLFFEDFKSNQVLILAWVVFLFSLVFFYFFAEDGLRFAHANFVWGAQTALYILFVVSVRFILLKYTQNQISFRNRIICLSAYSLHVASGLFYIYTLSIGYCLF